MADPLTLLKNAIMTKQNIVIEGNDFVFGRQRFPKNTPTTFKSSTGGLLQLHAVYLCHLHKDLNRGPYILAVTKAGSTPVALNDKKELLAYLYGEIETSSQIINTGEASSAVPGQQTSLSSDTSMPDIDRSNLSAQSSIATLQQQKQPIDDGLNKDFEFKDISYGNLILNKVELNELDLNEQQQNQKREYSQRINQEKVKNQNSIETEDSFIESIKQKRTVGDLEKSDFLLADEKLIKLVQSREKQISDRVSILQSTSDFTNILNSFKKFKSDEEEKKRKPTSFHQTGSNINSSGNKPINGHHHHHHNGTNSHTSSPNTSSNSPSIVSTNRIPIIIVPSTLTAPLSLYNIKEFLQSAKFVSSMEKKSEFSAQNIAKPNYVDVERMSSSGKLIYEVYDNVKLLKPEDWNRVAAVFVQGETWQFKDYKWSSPVDLLSHVKGYYLKFDDVTLPDVVKSWDVKILNISKSKRHLDQTAQIEFWNNFDEYILAKKPFLNH